MPSIFILTRDGEETTKKFKTRAAIEKIQAEYSLSYPENKWGFVTSFLSLVEVSFDVSNKNDGMVQQTLESFLRKNGFVRRWWAPMGCQNWVGDMGLMDAHVFLELGAERFQFTKIGVGDYASLLVR